MNILVVAAHPDDEVLGCGGTIAQHTAAGDEVQVIFMAAGRDDIKSRTMALDAASVMKTQNPLFLGHEDQKLDTYPLLRLTQHIERVADRFLPDVVLTHSSADLNKDHRIVHEATLTAFRPIGDSPDILCFEVTSSTEWGERAFTPNYFVDISNYTETLLQALQCYKEEMRPFPHPRSYVGITHQYRMRGAQAGLHAAEAFEVVRILR
jgi:LmbE family N-acetylglucosaminyl deacetylase